MREVLSQIMCLILLVLFAYLFLNQLTAPPNGEGSENDYGTYYDGCTDPYIGC